MLVRLLQKYFGPDFHYCNFYAEPPGCCGTVPCSTPRKTQLSKNHDFDLKVPQVAGQKYLIQYRDFVPSVVSNFELYVRQGNPDTQGSFRTFVSAEFARYRGFVDKWVTSEFGRRQLVLRYDDFLADPAAGLARAVAYFDAGAAVDPERIRMAVDTIDGERIEQSKVTRLQASGVHQPRDVTAFRHYRPALFEKLAKLSLTRAEVARIYQGVHNKPVPENKMLQLQTHESPQALQAALERHVAVKARKTAAGAVNINKKTD